MSSFEWGLPDRWSATEQALYTRAFEPVGAFNDDVAQALFNEGFFNRDLSSNERVAIREALRDYMVAEYDVSFDDVFDWETWRELYEDN